MRVIAGAARGRRLKTLRSRAVRPTADRVKEAIFSMLGSRVDLGGLRVLDLYAGSGALGIEAISRGAAHCTFVERDRAVAQVLRQNLAACGFVEQSRVVVGPIAAVIGRIERPFDLVLLDPPYADRAAQSVLGQLDRGGLVAAGGFVVIEHDCAEQVRGEGALQLTLARGYGSTCVTLLMATRPEHDSAP